MKWIRELSGGDRSISGEGDTLTSPKAAVALIGMGAQAVPTILHEVRSTGLSWTRDVLIEVLGRIGDARARPLLEDLLDHPS